MHILAGIIESTLCKQRKLLPKRSLNESIFIFVFIVTQAKRIPGANVSFGAKCLQTHFPKFGGIGLVPTNNVTETQDSGFLSRFQILGSGLILPCYIAHDVHGIHSMSIGVFHPALNYSKASGQNKLQPWAQASVYLARVVWQQESPLTYTKPRSTDLSMARQCFHLPCV